MNTAVAAAARQLAEMQSYSVKPYGFNWVVQTPDGRELPRLYPTESAGWCAAAAHLIKTAIDEARSPTW